MEVRLTIIRHYRKLNVELSARLNISRLIIPNLTEEIDGNMAKRHIGVPEDAYIVSIQYNVFIV